MKNEKEIINEMENLLTEKGLNTKELNSIKQKLNPTNGNGNGTMKALKIKELRPYITRWICGKSDIRLLTEAFDKRLNTLLIGETGTGKTHAVQRVAQKLKLPFMRVNFDNMITVEDLVGEYKPSGNGFVWQDGVLTKFVRHGGIFVADEINAAPAGILFILHALLDEGRQIVIRQKDGEVLKAHKNFWFVGCMNPDYEGTKPLNQALYDRFQVILNYDYDKGTEKKLIKDPKLLKLAEKLRKVYMKGEITTPCSTRQLLQYEENLKTFNYQIAKEIFVNRFAIDEQKPVKEAFSLHMPVPKPPKAITAKQIANGPAKAGGGKNA